MTKSKWKRHFVLKDKGQIGKYLLPRDKMLMIYTSLLKESYVLSFFHKNSKCAYIGLRAPGKIYSYVCYVYALEN